MSKIKTKELIICIISVLVLIIALITDVFAVSDIEMEMGNDTNNIAIITEQGGNNTVNNTVNNTNNNMANNKTNTNTTTIPNTGVDYSVIFIIAICGVSAIYAYKKIRDYNNF